MRRYPATGLIALFTAILAACTNLAPQPAPPELDLTGGGQMTLAPDWALLPDGQDGRRTRGERLTRYGVGLDQIWVAADMKPGQRLVEASADTQDGPVWAEAGSADNPSEFLAGSLAALGYYGFSEDGTPLEANTDWGPTSAFTVRTGRGLAYRGEVRARLRGERLDLALWLAEADIYAERIETEAHAMLASLD